METLFYISLILNFICVPPVAYLFFLFFKLKKLGYFKNLKPVIKEAIKKLSKGNTDKRITEDIENNIIDDVIDKNDFLDFLQNKTDGKY